MYALSEQNAGVYDTGFILLVPSDTPAAPLGTAGYRRYQKRSQADAYLRSLGEALAMRRRPGYLPFGSAQRPALDQYADGEDTMEFLRFFPLLMLCRDVGFAAVVGEKGRKRW